LTKIETNAKEVKKLKKILVLLVVMAFMSIAVSAFAATTTQNLLVSASVANSCRITSVTDVNFSTPYDPTDASPNDSGQGDFTFSCTRGTNYDLYITGTRQMTNGTDNLSYQLYQEAARSNTWPAALPGVAGTSANNAPVTVGIYGRIAAGQDVGAGAYNGTVVITVEY